jgi:hypothetical protein
LDDIAVICTRLLNFRRIGRLWKVGKAVGMDRKDTGILFRRMSADEKRAVYTVTLQRAGFTYLLYKGGTGWKISELIATDLDKLISAD